MSSRLEELTLSTSRATLRSIFLSGLLLLFCKFIANLGRKELFVRSLSQMPAETSQGPTCVSNPCRRAWVL